MQKILLTIIKSFRKIDRNKLQLIKGLVIGFAIPIICLWAWFEMQDVITRFLFITQPKSKTFAHVYNFKAGTSTVEYNDQPGSGNMAEADIDYYSFNYYFKLPNGRKIISEGTARRDEIDELLLVEEGEEIIHNRPNNILMKVEYITSKPNLSRLPLTQFDEWDLSISEFIRKRIIIGFLSFLFSIYISRLIVEGYIKKYKNAKNIDFFIKETYLSESIDSLTSLDEIYSNYRTYCHKNKYKEFSYGVFKDQISMKGIPIT